MTRHHRRLLRRLRTMLAGRDPRRPTLRRMCPGLWTVQWAGGTITGARTRREALRGALDIVRWWLA